jgi:hypothetical protein
MMSWWRRLLQHVGRVSTQSLEAAYAQLVVLHNYRCLVLRSGALLAAGLLVPVMSRPHVVPSSTVVYGGCVSSRFDSCAYGGTLRGSHRSALHAQPDTARRYGFSTATACMCCNNYRCCLHGPAMRAGFRSCLLHTSLSVWLS